MTEFIAALLALFVGLLGALRAWELFSSWTDV